MSNSLLHAANRRIEMEINAWRMRYPEVIEFPSVDYSATIKQSPQEGLNTVVWSDSFHALMEGRARVRMNPLPKTLAHLSA